jgi:hypothetical protein
MLPPWAPSNFGEEMVEEVPRYNRLPPNDDEVRADNVVPLRPDREKEFIAYMRQHALLAQHQKPILDAKDDILCETGLTQLYISKNKLTSEGIRHLLESTNRLQVLDAGSVPSTSLGGSIKYTTSFSQPNSVNPLLHRTGTRMEVLRIHHSVVTYCPTIMSSSEQTRGYKLNRLHHAETVFGPAQKSSWATFSPSDNHRIKHLTLTGIPTKSYGFIIEQLKAFLTDAAKQEQKLLAEAPTHRRAPQKLSGLKKLTLEMMREDTAATAGGGSSASGDRDADTFAEESEKDFSFFKPDLNAGFLGGQVQGRIWKSKLPGEDGVVYDVVDELKKFREEMEAKWNGKVEVKYPREVGAF